MTPERERETGLTLVEVVVALVVLGILAMATLGILLNTQRTSVDARARVGAANLAAREIDLVREKFLASDDGPLTVANEGVVVNGNPLTGGAVGDPLELDGTQYTVRRSATWNIMGAGASACEGGSIVDHPALTVEVEVTWPGMGSTKPVRSSTILAPERGQGLAACHETHASPPDSLRLWNKNIRKNEDFPQHLWRPAGMSRLCRNRKNDPKRPSFSPIRGS